MRRSERLARENLAAEPDEHEFMELDPRNPADFEELVREALDDLPDLLITRARPRRGGDLRQGPPPPRVRPVPGGRVARDDAPDRIVIFRDTLLRDFGDDPDELRAQVTRTVRHELAHHLGADELGVRELGLVMIVMTPEAGEAEIAAVRARLETTGVHVLVLPGELTTAIGAIGDPEGVRELGLEGMAGVDRVVPISRPYKLASSELAHHEPTVFAVDGHTIGGAETFALIAGPCTVESREQTLERRAHRRGGGRLHAARRRVQAAHLAVRVQGARARRRSRSSPRRARRPGCRSSPSCSTPRTPSWSPSTPT